MPADHVHGLTERLETFQPTIAGLHLVRDEWIAHTDQLGGIAPYHNFFPSTEKLINFGFELLDTCSQAVLDTPVFNTLNKTTIGDLQLTKKENTSTEVRIEIPVS
jgi:hypothetical protein